MLEFEISSKSRPGESHQVKARRDGLKIIITCTCQAAQNSQWCGHRLNLLTDPNPSTDDGRVLRSWMPDSQLPPILAQIAKLEAEAAAVKALVSGAKKTLGRALVGQ